MKRIPLALAALSLTLALGACAPSAGTNGQLTPAPSDSADHTDTPAGVLSSFSTTDLDGNTVDQSVLADYDLTMVNVWATFCTPCIDEMPDLGELAQEYADKNVQIIGLVSDVLNTDGTISDDQVATARDIVSQTQANYLHLLPGEDLFGLLSQISAVPTTFFVDSEGVQVGSAIVSAQSKEAWSETIDQMLAEVQA